ncbi:hypothetical protein T492DRAFT_466942 [Pavlovales sp. CCMP2436]|nr:hypothetical protein T492DRAFT_466942 [Pavlovales sp. CCMP2436]
MLRGGDVHYACPQCHVQLKASLQPDPVEVGLALQKGGTAPKPSAWLTAAPPMSLPVMKVPVGGAGGAASSARARVPAQVIPSAPPPGPPAPVRIPAGGSTGAGPSSANGGGGGGSGGGGSGGGDGGGGALEGQRRKSGGGGGPKLVGKLRLAITCPNCALAIDRVEDLSQCKLVCKRRAPLADSLAAPAGTPEPDPECWVRTHCDRCNAPLRSKVPDAVVRAGLDDAERATAEERAADAEAQVRDAARVKAEFAARRQANAVAEEERKAPGRRTFTNTVTAAAAEALMQASASAQSQEEAKARARAAYAAAQAVEAEARGKAEVAARTAVATAEAEAAARVDLLGAQRGADEAEATAAAMPQDAGLRQRANERQAAMRMSLAKHFHNIILTNRRWVKIWSRHRLPGPGRTAACSARSPPARRNAWRRRRSPCPCPSPWGWGWGRRWVCRRWRIPPFCSSRYPFPTSRCRTDRTSKRRTNRRNTTIRRSSSRSR